MDETTQFISHKCHPSGLLGWKKSISLVVAGYQKLDTSVEFEYLFFFVGFIITQILVGS